MTRDERIAQSLCSESAQRAAASELSLDVVISYWRFCNEDPDHPHWRIAQPVLEEELSRRFEAGELPSPLPDDVALVLMKAAV